MLKTPRSLVVLLALWLTPLSASVFAQPQAAAPVPASRPLFAVQIRTGGTWDPAKSPQQQALFKEHSANLNRLRDAGDLVMGARYSDIGLVVLAADSASARAMMDMDPSFNAGTFRYELHPLNVFYAGTLNVGPRAAERP